MDHTTKRYSFLLVILLLLSAPVLVAIHAQPEKEIKEVWIGDKVPDIAIAQVLNYPGNRLRLSELKGKLIIIDFWGTTCASCIAALPGIEKLQQQFRDRLQVLTVTDFDNADKVQSTLQRFRQTRDVKLPVILHDDQLQRMFPYELVSHVVWIDGNGIVKAITGTEHITAANIQSVLDGETINWPIKRDVPDFDYDKPLLSLSNTIITPPSIYYSTFTGYISGIDATDKVVADSLLQTVTRNYFNHTLLQFCDGSLNGSGTGYISPKRLILEVPDEQKYFRKDQYRADWEKKNTFTYSVSLPLHLPQAQMASFIKEDLTRWLKLRGIIVKKENRLVSCLVLKRIQTDDRLLTSKGGGTYDGLDDTTAVKKLINSSFSNLLWHLNEGTPAIPWVIDESGIKPDMKVDMTLAVPSLGDIPSLRMALLKYGLTLESEKRELEMYVITENKQQ